MCGLHTIVGMATALTLAMPAAEPRQTETPADVAPPGRLVNVDGHRLHVHCQGRGAPTVVIDGGAGTWSIHYSHIQAALVGQMRVCTYDRAGLGWSDEGPLPRTSGRMVTELHQLLHAAGIQPPLLLVGHSLGGYNVRIYQHRYPEEVGGLVLVEAGHESQWERLPPEWAAGVKANAAWLRERAEDARQGRIHEADVKPGAFTAHATEWRDAHVAAQLTAKMYLGVAAENEGAFESARQVPRGQLGRLPVVVLTARRSFDAFAGSGLDIEPANRVWLGLQDELASLSSNVARLFSERAHDLHASDPAAVIEAVRKGAAMLRDAAPVPAALGLRAGALPAASTAEIDRLLSNLEEAYASMDADRFASFYTEDVVQLDVPRHVHVKGRDEWVAWTRTVNGAHRSMRREHRGRAQTGEWIVAEVEWSGRVKGEALASSGDRDYRYTGLVLMRLSGGRIAEQVIYGDAARLSEQLRGDHSLDERGRPRRGVRRQPWRAVMNGALTVIAGRTVLNGILLFTAVLGLGANHAPPTSVTVPSWVDAYFESMTGVWTTDNSAYRSDAEPIDAYGMEWKPGIGKKSLVGRLYGMRDGREVGVSWEFREFWHPGDAALLATQFGSDGTYGVGPHERKADGTMEMLQTFYHPTGDVTRTAHRSTRKGDELITQSFDVQGDTWKPRRKYVWHRQRP